MNQLEENWTKCPNWLFDVIADGKAVTKNEIRVLMYLDRQQYGFKNKDCFTGTYNKLATLLKMKWDAVNSILKSLENKGFIKIITLFPVTPKQGNDTSKNINKINNLHERKERKKNSTKKTLKEAVRARACAREISYDTPFSNLLDEWIENWIYIYGEQTTIDMIRVLSYRYKRYGIPKDLTDDQERPEKYVEGCFVKTFHKEDKFKNLLTELNGLERVQSEMDYREGDLSEIDKEIAKRYRENPFENPVDIKRQVIKEFNKRGEE